MTPLHTTYANCALFTELQTSALKNCTFIAQVLVNDRCAMLLKENILRILGTIMKFKHQSNFESSSVTASQLYSTVDPHHVSQELF